MSNYCPQQQPPVFVPPPRGYPKPKDAFVPPPQGYPLQGYPAPGYLLQQGHNPYPQPPLLATGCLDVCIAAFCCCCLYDACC